MRLLPLALAGLLVERVIYKVNSFQFTRSARLLLALQRNAKNAYLCATPLMNTANSLSDQYGPVDELSIYSHSGNLNGPIFPLDPGGLNDNQYYADELGPFQNLNWGPNSRAMFYGCHSASFAKYFSDNVWVPSYGFPSGVDFSSNPNQQEYVPGLTLGINTYAGPLYMVGQDGTSMTRVGP